MTMNNKALYPWLIFFIALVTLSGLADSIVHLLIGAQLYYLDAYDGWFVTSNLLAMISTVLLLIYFYRRKFRFVFVAGVFGLICFIPTVILTYWIIRWHGPRGFYRPLVLVYFLSVMICGISLVCLRVANARWLRVGGGYLAIYGVVSLILFVGSTLSPSFSKSVSAVRLPDWMEFVGSLEPIPYLLYFILERRRNAVKGVDLAPRKPTPWFLQLGAAVIVMLLVTFVLGVSFEGYKAHYWAGIGHEKTKELAQQCEPGVFVNQKGESLDYWVLKPVDYDSTKKYPLVVALPYGSDDPTDSLGQIDGAVGASLLSTGSNRTTYPAFIFIPGRKPGTAWGGIPGYSTVDTLVFDAIASLDSRYSIDDKRRYVVGLSLGAFGAWDFICKRPDLFAAAIPVAGGGDPRLAPNGIHVAVWAFHGSNDHNAPVTGSRNMIEAMKNAGGKPLYTEYAGEGHNIWDKVAETPGLGDWLFAQRRE